MIRKLVICDNCKVEGTPDYKAQEGWLNLQVYETKESAPKFLVSIDICYICRSLFPGLVAHVPTA